jgi:hypothetical protein
VHVRDRGAASVIPLTATEPPDDGDDAEHDDHGQGDELPRMARAVVDRPASDLDRVDGAVLGTRTSP